MKACPWYRYVTIPWGSWLWLKHQDVKNQDVSFLKLTQLAALAVHNPDLSKDVHPMVLFGTYYLCDVLADGYLPVPQMALYWHGQGESQHFC